jgi:Coenzyme PQQ synthesis protein D (PqqD)
VQHNAGAGPDPRLRRSPHALERRTVASVVVIGSGMPLVLRDTAVAIWDAFDTPQRVSEVTERLAGAYGTTAAVVGPDVQDAVQRLRAEGLLVDVETGTEGGRGGVDG